MILLTPAPTRELDTREKDEKRRRWVSEELFEVGAEQKRSWSRQVVSISLLPWLVHCLAGRGGGGGDDKKGGAEGTLWLCSCTIMLWGVSGSG